MQAQTQTQTEVQFEAIVQYVQAQKSRKSVEALATELSLSRTQVYNIAKGLLYRKNGQKEFSDSTIKRLYHLTVSYTNPVETAVFTELRHIVESAKKEPVMRCVFGSTGIGKTTTYKHIARTTDKVYYVLCNHLDSVADFMQNICAALGLQSKEIVALKGKKLRKRIIEEVAEFAAKQDNGDVPVLILDDIHHLPASVYQDVKLLFDEVEKRGLMSFILSGTEQLEINLKKWAGFDREMNLKYKKKPMMDELLRRFKDEFYGLSALSEADLVKVMSHYGLSTDKVMLHQIAKHFVKKSNLEMGMFCNKIQKALQVVKTQEMAMSYGLVVSL